MTWYLRLTRRLSNVALGLGFLGLWALVGLAFTAVAPAAGYILNWPLISAGAAWLWVLHRPRADLLLLVPAGLAGLLFAPILLLGFWGAGLMELWAQAIIPALTAGLAAAAIAGVAPAGRG